MTLVDRETGDGDTGDRFDGLRSLLSNSDTDPKAQTDGGTPLEAGEGGVDGTLEAMLTREVGVYVVPVAVLLLVWFAVFPVAEDLHPVHVLVEGTYLTLSIALFVLARRLDVPLLGMGWAVFVYARLVDLLSELTVEPQPLVNPLAEGLLTSVGLLVIMIGLYEVVTTRDERLQELRRQNDRLESFASIVSHDLRNPLDVACGRTRLAQQTGDLDHLDEARIAQERMVEIIDDVLTMTRQGQPVEDVSPVDLADLAETTWTTVETGDATLEVDADTAVEADMGRLRQLLENLVRNAVEHGGDDVTVRIGTTEDGFYVEDDGSGIPPDEREKAFETGHSTVDGNAGLGLAIVEELSQAHGWEVRVSESHSGGARFDVTGVTFAS